METYAIEMDIITKSLTHFVEDDDLTFWSLTIS